MNESVLIHNLHVLCTVQSTWNSVHVGVPTPPCIHSHLNTQIIFKWLNLGFPSLHNQKDQNEHDIIEKIRFSLRTNLRRCLWGGSTQKCVWCCGLTSPNKKEVVQHSVWCEDLPVWPEIVGETPLSGVVGAHVGNHDYPLRKCVHTVASSFPYMKVIVLILCNYSIWDLLIFSNMPAYQRVYQRLDLMFFYLIYYPQTSTDWQL